MSHRKPMPPNARMVFKGEIFEVWQWEQNMFDGSTATFERLRRDNTAQVVATVGDKILLLTQEQPDSAAPFPSMPGGRCEEGESPLQSAQRELLEETGYVSDDWVLWRESNPVGKIEWTIYTFIAHGCVKQQEPHPDAGEKLSARLVSFDEFLALADDPSFYDKEIVEPLLRARAGPEQKAALHRALFGA